MLLEEQQMCTDPIPSIVRLGFSFNSLLKQIDDIDGAAAHVAVAAMGPLGVVMHQPGVQVGL